MKEVYLTLPSRRLIRTFKLEYGQVKSKFIVRTFDRGINIRRTSEDYAQEEVFKNEEEMLNKVNKIKKRLIESRWVLHTGEFFPKTFFLNTEIIDGTIPFEFYVNIDPSKLVEKKMIIAKKFLDNLEEEIETNIRKGIR